MHAKCRQTFGTCKCHELMWRSALVCFERVRKIVKSDRLRCHVCQSAWNKSAPTDGFSWNLTFQYFAKNLLRKFKFHWNLVSIAETVHGQLCAFTVISQWIMLRIIIFCRNKCCRESPRTSYTFCKSFPAKSCRFWDNVEKYGRGGQSTDDNIWRMRVAC